MQKIYVMLTIMLLFLLQCDSESSPTESGEGNGSGNSPTSMKFLAFYEPDGENVMGDSKQIIKISVQNGEASYSSFYDLYPYGDDLFRNSDFNENVLAMGLHYDIYKDMGDGSSVGLYIDMASAEHIELPMVAPSEDSDYSYFLSSTSVVSDNGMILYLSATDDKSYGDEYRPYLIRYNTANNTHKVAASPENFVLNQPEKGDDTETGQINRYVCISHDGRYAYGVLEAYGVSGNIHWDYEILFQYDFETEEYKRLGEEGDADVTFYGMTRDGKHLIYDNNHTKKLLNLETENVSEVDFRPSHGLSPIETNDNGFCDDGTTGIYYWDCLANQEIKVINSYYTEDAQFTNGGDKLLFTLEGSDTNYICISEDLSEDTNWDTLAAVPEEFIDIKIIR
ncbi:MAG: hypothetical protein K9M80_09460 [Candidatus Marinimicrobia bacterium]|nr:hypothetical protein [Candidatus Neomarinimicrobiota bacterium]